jgi:hypothetical protein
LIEKVGSAHDDTAVYRATPAGLNLVEVPWKTEMRNVALGTRSIAEKTGAPRAVEKFVPRVGQFVWNLDWTGARKEGVYRVDEIGRDKARLSVWWSGPSFEPVREWQRFASLDPLNDKDLAAAVQSGMPLG